MNLYREFNYIVGSANKTWVIYSPRPAPAIAKVGYAQWTVTCRWGRIGSRLQSLTRYFDTEWHAKDFVALKVAEKLGKGYKEYLKTKFTASSTAPVLGSLKATIKPKCEHDRNLTRTSAGWKCSDCGMVVEFDKKSECRVTSLEAVRYFSLKNL